MPGTSFGSAVALSPDGLVLAVGAPRHDYDENVAGFLESAGAVYTYRYFGDSWISTGKVVGVNTFATDRQAGDMFGSSVALAPGKLAVGALYQDYGTAGLNFRPDTGAVYVFAESMWMFTIEKKLVSSGTPGRIAGDYFGKSAAIFGTRLIVGADGRDYDTDGGGRLERAGAVYLYEMISATEWGLSKKIGAGGAGVNARQANDAFGSAVAITDQIFAVGVPAHDYDSSGLLSVNGAGATFFYFR
jgi:hypothetical protein